MNGIDHDERHLQQLKSVVIQRGINEHYRGRGRHINRPVRYGSTIDLDRFGRVRRVRVRDFAVGAGECGDE